MQIRNLSRGPLAVEIRGIDLANRLDEEDWARCVDALAEHRVLVFRDQQLSPSQFLAFGRRWGRAVPHVLDHLRMGEVPEIMQIGNIGTTAAGEQVHHGADYWHTDQSYDADPVTSTMLYSIVAPDEGGETQFADMVQAYDALPRKVQKDIDGLRMRHVYGAASQGKVANISAKQRSTLPAVTHPLVTVHPQGGRRALYAIVGTAERIEGLSPEDSESLLEMLRAHALEERFIYRHPYRIGDLVVYDTTTTLHAATTIPKARGDRDRRLLWRISVTGGPPSTSR